jgi:hypothetical protein
MTYRKLSYEQMAQLLINNGWETLWHKDYWIKSKWRNDPTMNIDTCGYSTDVAFTKCKYEKMREHNYELFSKSFDKLASGD